MLNYTIHLVSHDVGVYVVSIFRATFDKYIRKVMFRSMYSWISMCLYIEDESAQSVNELTIVTVRFGNVKRIQT